MNITPVIPSFHYLSHARIACAVLAGKAHRHRHHLMRMAATFLPLLVLLVGSCKTSELPAAYGGNTGPEQMRVALFPDSVNFKGVNYHPAAGYITRAQKYVAGAPDTLSMLTHKEITYLFGMPAQVRRDADANIWQYKVGSCIVDFYFYEDPGNTARMNVSYVDVRDYRHPLPASDAAEQPLSLRQKCLGRVIDKGDFSSTRI